MGEAYRQVVDFRPSKGMASSTSNEIQRKRSDKAANYADKVGNYDPTRQQLNFEIVKGGKVQSVDKTRSIPSRIRETLKARGIKDPNEGLDPPKYRTVVNFILEGTRNRMLEIAFGDQKVDLNKGADNSHIQRTKDIEQWARDMYDFFAKRYGEDNIVSFVVHLDETNPHAHLTLLPIDQNNRFAYKKIFAGKDIYDYREKNRALHDDLAAVNAKWGLHRGSDITVTGAKHRTTEEYRRQLNEECTDMEEQLDSGRKTLAELQKEIKLAETRVKGLTAMITNLEKQRKEITDQLDRCYKSLSDGTTRPEDIDAQIRELRSRLSRIETGLADKNAKLDIARQKLEKLQSDMSNAKMLTDRLNAQANALAESITDMSRTGVTDAMYNVLMEEFKHMMANADDATIDQFDDSMLMDFARRGNAIAKCAVMLLGGYVDQATEFAQGHGGGGGGSDMKWGRDPDEDDRRWARRCVRMANQMMKPAATKKVKR